MTFEALELSHESGAPVELYTFTRNTVIIARYTSSEADIVIGSDTYVAWPGGIERGPIATTADEGRNSLTIRVARDHPIAHLIHYRPRTGVLGVTLAAYHRADPGDIKTIWFGRVLSAKRDKKSGARMLQCEPRSVSQARTGLRRLASATCMHELYGPLCRLNKADWKHITTIASITGNVITVADVAALPYAGGIIERTDSDGVTDTAYINTVSGTTLTLDLAIWGATIGDTVTIYPGCDWTMTVCDTVFGNSANYGGRLHIPEKNPVTQSAFS